MRRALTTVAACCESGLMPLAPQRYARPLRALALDVDTAVLPRYEAQRLFGNIGEIVGANMAFLRELELCVQSAERENLGDVLHRHVSAASALPAVHD
jgi:hypothetical protein